MEEADVIMTALQNDESDAHKSQRETHAQKRAARWQERNA